MKGFGFVGMENSDEAKSAIEALNEKEFEGRNLRINEAKPRENRPRQNYNNRY
jgi:RNA recognition motif-containing protein